MKSYPSIQKSSVAPKGKGCYVFVKYDGSNLRFEFSKKRGWYKFGTRNHLFDRSDPVFGSAIDLFIGRYGGDLEEIFRKEKLFRGIDNIIVYAEWFGAKTFAGMHVQDDPKEIVLFDVNPITKGLLGSKDFLEIFGHLRVAELLSREIFNNKLIQEVREGRFNCQSRFTIANEIPEGVVCKAGSGHNIFMTKIKTNQYLEKLKEHYQHNWSQYWE